MYGFGDATSYVSLAEVVNQLQGVVLLPVAFASCAVSSFPIEPLP